MTCTSIPWLVVLQLYEDEDDHSSTKEVGTLWWNGMKGY